MPLCRILYGMLVVRLSTIINSRLLVVVHNVMIRLE